MEYYGPLRCHDQALNNGVAPHSMGISFWAINTRPFPFCVDGLGRKDPWSIRWPFPRVAGHMSPRSSPARHALAPRGPKSSAQAECGAMPRFRHTARSTEPQILTAYYSSMMIFHRSGTRSSSSAAHRLARHPQPLYGSVPVRPMGPGSDSNLFTQSTLWLYGSNPRNKKQEAKHALQGLHEKENRPSCSLTCKQFFLIAFVCSFAYNMFPGWNCGHWT